MGGLRKILKLYGRMKVADVMWVWDYANEQPVKEKEMTKEMFAASEKAKWQQAEKLLPDFLNKKNQKQ